MTLKITLTMDNAAFEPDPGIEVARILRALADRAEVESIEDGRRMVLRDFNGNSCGKAEVVR